MQLRHIPRNLSRTIRGALGIIPKDLRQIVSDLQPGETFVDVGANIGLFSLQAARRVGPTGKVLAIEPNPALVETLKTAIAARGAANVQVAPVAVGERDGLATLHMFQQHTRSSLLRTGRISRYTLDEAHRIEPISVTVEPLECVLNRFGITTVHALKIDIEGYEDKALLPFFKAAPTSLWPHRIMIERSERVWERDCIACMVAYGYRVQWRSTNDAMLCLPNHNALRTTARV